MAPEPPLIPLKTLRTIATSAGAVAIGLARAATRSGERSTLTLAAGDEAPDFELPGSDGRMYHLRDVLERDAVVLAWFPKAFTGGCTRECESLARDGAALRPYAVRYFAASTDTPDTNRRFAASMQIDYPILSDPDKATARAYGVLGASGFPSRWTFYIGRDGRILEVDRRVAVATHGRDIAANLVALGIPLRA